MENGQGAFHHKTERVRLQVGCVMVFPQLTPVTALDLRPGEVFVCAGGFEGRCLKFPQILQPCKQPRSTAVLLQYFPHNERNRFEQIASVLRDKGCQVAAMPYDRHAPGTFDTSFSDTLTRVEASGVCLDISGMSRLAIMIIVDVVRELNLPLRVVYVEALDYAPSLKEFQEAKASGQQHIPTSFIHTGVYDVVRIPRLSSIRMQNHATLLIAFDSFNEALCQALVNVISPSRFILINGRPPREKLRWREKATAYVHERLREEWSVENDNDPIKVTSTLKYKETHDVLVELYWRFSATHRIILAPTGSKMQTLGSYLLRAVHDDVHVEYPTVEGFFAEKYSRGIRETWELDFGKMGDFTGQLRQRELKEHLDLPEKLVNADID